MASNPEKTAKNSLQKSRSYFRHQEKVLERNRQYRGTYVAKYNSLLRRARNKGIVCDLTFDDYVDVVSSGVCHYSGDPLPEKGYGLDRKDPLKGYTKDNVVPCCAWVNTLKNMNLTYEDTVEVVKLIISKRRSRTQINVDRVDKTGIGPEDLPPMEGIVLVGMDVLVPPEGVVAIRTAEFKKNPEIVKSMILHKQGRSRRIFARTCQVKKVTNSEARLFQKRTHLKGYSGSSINIGLFHDEALVCLMSIKNYGRGIYELNRFSCELNTAVVGGFSKCLSEFVKLEDPVQIFSYVDMRYHDGDSYSDWEYVGTTRGFWWTNGIEMFNRLKFKSNMDNRYLKQEEYAGEQGFWKIYDAGQAKFVKNFKEKFDERPKGITGDRQDKLDVYYESERLRGYRQLEERLAEKGFNLLSTYEDYCSRSNGGRRWVEIACSNGHIKKHRADSKVEECKSCSFSKDKGRDYSESGLKAKLSAMGYEYISGEWDNGKNSEITFRDATGQVFTKKWRYITR